MLQINNINKSFGSDSILKDLSIRFKYGNIIGIVGANGAGKSTLFDILAGFKKADSGQIYVNNGLINNLQPFQVAKLGLIKTFQLNGVFENLTVYENLELAIVVQPHMSFLDKLRFFFRFKNNKYVEDIIDKSLKEVNLLDHKYRLAKNLSGGQRKLLEFARVQLQNWQILLLDEPLAGVNKNLKPFLIKLVKGLKDYNKLILVIEHDTEFVQKISDKVYLLDNGVLERQ